MPELKEPNEEPKGIVPSLAKALGIVVTCAAFIGLIMAGTVVLQYRASVQAEPDKNPPLAVDTQEVKLINYYPVKQLFAGQVEAARETRLAFERNGLVIKVIANEGDHVKKGEVVARLDVSQLKTRLDQLEAQKNELTAQLNLAKATLERRSSLKKKGWSPTQSYDEARFSVQQFAASLERVEASIKSLKIDLEKSELRTPFAGTVAARAIDEGAVVNAGTPVLTLLEATRSQVRVGVSVDAAANLKKDVAYRFRINGQIVKGYLVSKRRDLQAGTRTVTALFDLKGGDDVPLGEIAELEFEKYVKDTGTWLPLTALIEGRKGLWTVYTVNKDDVVLNARREAVEVLHSSGGRVFVRGTFRNGDLVVVNGTNRIIPGQKIVLARKE